MSLNELVRARIAIDEALAKMQVGDGRCLKCGHIGPASDFTAGDPSTFGKGGHADHLYCSACHQSVTWYGYLVKMPDGKLRRVA